MQWSWQQVPRQGSTGTSLQQFVCLKSADSDSEMQIVQVIQPENKQREPNRGENRAPPKLDYQDVQEVRQKGMSKGVKIALVVLAGVVIAAVIVGETITGGD